MSGFNLTYWLRKLPRPVAVMADDQRIEVPRTGRAWRDLTETINALEPSKITCLDGQGKVLRSRSMEEADGSPQPSAAAPSAEMSDLQFFAKLLAEAYREGRAANQPIVDNAMGFVDRQGQRLAKAETEIDRLRAHVHKQSIRIAELSQAPMLEAPEGESSIMGTLLAGVVQGAAASQQKQAAPAVVSPIKNGAKK